MIGIYAIQNKLNGKFIVGSSSDIKKRWSNYLTNLHGNTYGNKLLQAEWNEYGEENFEFVVLEELKKKADLAIREKHWIDLYWNTGLLYNIRSIKKTIKKLRRGREAANHKEKMSSIQSGENNPRHSGLLKAEDVVIIKLLLDKGVKNKEIHKQFEDKVSQAMISRIKCGDRYKSVHVEDYPEIVKQFELLSYS